MMEQHLLDQAQAKRARYLAEAQHDALVQEARQAQAHPGSTRFQAIWRRAYGALTQARTQTKFKNKLGEVI